MSRFPILLAFSLLTTSPVAAQQAPQPKKPVQSKDPSRVICERQEEIGTRLGHTTICMTAAQWAAKRQEEQDETRRFQSDSGCGHHSHC